MTVILFAQSSSWELPVRSRGTLVMHTAAAKHPAIKDTSEVQVPNVSQKVRAKSQAHLGLSLP